MSCCPVVPRPLLRAPRLMPRRLARALFRVPGLSFGAPVSRHFSASLRPNPVFSSAQRQPLICLQAEDKDPDRFGSRPIWTAASGRPREAPNEACCSTRMRLQPAVKNLPRSISSPPTRLDLILWSEASASEMNSAAGFSRQLRNLLLAIPVFARRLEPHREDCSYRRTFSAASLSSPALMEADGLHPCQAPPLLPARSAATPWGQAQIPAGS